MHTLQFKDMQGRLQLQHVYICNKLISVATWSMVWICSCSLGRIVGWNPAGSIDVCLLSVLCVVR